MWESGTITSSLLEQLNTKKLKFKKKDGYMLNIRSLNKYGIQ